MLSNASFLVTPPRPEKDPIFGLAEEAAQRGALGERVVNASIGVLVGDDGKLAVLPTAARALKELAVEDIAPYAPISGVPAYLEAVLDDLFVDRPDARAAAVACSTPGGSGALRHAMTCFLERGQAALTTSYYWGPYATLADENERRVVTFRMFADDRRADALDTQALDDKLGELIQAQGRALLILNDPCHNPTGYSLSAADWSRVGEVVSRHAAKAPVTVLLDSAYSTFGPSGLEVPMTELVGMLDQALVLFAFSASKSFTYYGLRVGALVAIASCSEQRRKLSAAFAYACRGTWSNCNRAGMTAVARILRNPDSNRSIVTERRALMTMLDARVRAFNDAAAKTHLRYPRYDGGFFVTVFASDAYKTAEALKREGIYVVPQRGALRVGVCAVPARDVEEIVTALARHVAE